MPSPGKEVFLEDIEIEENRQKVSQNKAVLTRKPGLRQAAMSAKANLKNKNKSEKSTAPGENAKEASATSTETTTANAKGKKGTKKPTTANKKVCKKVLNLANTEDDKATSSTQTKGKKAPKVKKSQCVEECLPGPKSGCCQRSRRRLPGQLNCVEVFDLLKKLGVENFSNLSKCLLSGLMSGCIEVPEGADLDTTMFEFKGIHCEHKVIVTMRKLLYQRDYGGDDYEDNGERATVWCESHGEGEEDCELGRYYVTSLCQGRPSLDSGKFHNHCGKCPGFGRCLGDYRCHCRVDKTTGRHMKEVLFGSWDDDDDDDGGYLDSDDDGHYVDSDDSDEEMVGRGGQECSIS